MIEFPTLSYFDESVLPFSVQRGVERALARLVVNPMVHEVLGAMGFCPEINFHNRAHCASVVRMAVVLAVIERYSEDEVLLTGLAALCHDIGFTPLVGGAEQGNGVSETHEVRGARYLKKKLEAQGMHGAAVAEAVRMVLDTELYTGADGVARQYRIHSSRSGVLMDADLHNIGTTAFCDHLLRLYREQHHSGVASVEGLRAVPDGAAYVVRTLAFLEAHRWQTAGAAELFGTTKAQNITLCRDLLGKDA